MIRMNDSPEYAMDEFVPECDLHSEAHRRTFRKILTACEEFLEVFRVDYDKHVALGIYIGLPDECRDAWLSYNRDDQSVRLSTRFRNVRLTSDVQLLMLFRLQASAGLVRFHVDETRNHLILEAVSICPDPDGARAVVEPMSESLRRVLQDDRLGVALQARQASVPG